MSLTREDLAAAGQDIFGREIATPVDTHVIKPPPHLMSRLSNLHEATIHLAKTAPDILEKPEVARAMEEALVHAMTASISEGEGAEIGSVYRHHVAIIRRLEEVLEANLDQTLYVAEVCKAIGVSEKTLRLCCQEHFGMSSKQYLVRRRMHLAHRALRIANPARTTVSEIATSYGFWEFGRFSVAYRSLFGETPSASLRRPPDDPRPWKSVGSPWQLPGSA